MPINMKEFGKLHDYVNGRLDSLTEAEKKARKKEQHRRSNERLREERLRYSREYRVKHKDKIKESHKKYNAKNPKKTFLLGAFGELGYTICLHQQVDTLGIVLGFGHFTQIRTPEQNRAREMKHILKGATVLNEPFEGAEAHHMAKDVVVFVPKELHKSVKHNLETGEGMDEINGKALVWAGRQSNG